jgi:hypothetical protein
VTRPPVLLIAIVAALAIAAPATAAGPAGSLPQLAGTAGCITDDGTSNGVAVQCADGRGLSGAEAVTLSPDGRFAYSYSYDTGAIAILARDPATGALSQADNSGACVGPTDIGTACTDGRFPGVQSDSGHAIVISPDGAFLFAAGSTGSDRRRLQARSRNRRAHRGRNRRKKLGKKRSGKLVAKARYGGNAALNAKSSKALTVRYG